MKRLLNSKEKVKCANCRKVFFIVMDEWLVNGAVNVYKIYDRIIRVKLVNARK